MHARPIIQIHWKLSSRMQSGVQIIQLLFVSIAEVISMFFSVICLHCGMLEDDYNSSVRLNLFCAFRVDS